MADQKMVKVDMENTVGLRGAEGGAAVLYGPGKDIEVPEKLARGLGLTPKTMATQRKAADEPESVDFASMKVAELEDFLRSKEVDVSRLKGTGGRSKDQVVQADLVKAAQAKAAGEEPEYVEPDITPQGDGNGTETGDTPEGGTDATGGDTPTEENQGGQE